MDAFIVTDMTGDDTVIESIPVYSLNEIKVDNDTLIVVAAKKFAEEINESLSKKQWPMSAVYNWNWYIN